MRLSHASLILLALLCLPLVAKGKPQTFPNSPKGFDKQYRGVFQAYEKGDEKRLLDSFRTFALPNHWFADDLGPDKGSNLREQYLYRFRDFQTETVDEFNRVLCDADSGCNQGQIKTRAAKASELGQLSAARTSLPPTVVVQRFRIEHFSIGPFFTQCPLVPREEGEAAVCMAGAYPAYLPGGNHRKSWVSSFVYVDGAFRFVGWSICPFWEACAGNQLIENEPNTPPEAVHFNLMQKSKSRDLLGWMTKLVGKNQ